MSNFLPKHAGALFKPQSHALALEPRILFDGAAAVAVDQQQDSASHEAAGDLQAPASPVEAPTGQAAPRHLLVLDSRVEDRAQLVRQLPAGVQTLVVEAGQDGIAAIEQALEALGQVDSIQILSHGSAGQFSLGSSHLSSDNIGQLGQSLQQWRDNLSEGADIQLYGCRVGAGSAGQTLVDELARWSGADVAASDDATGSLAAGGDWTLEVRNGDIDQAIALNTEARAGYDQLLPDASPTTALPVAGDDVLLGNNFTFTVNFTNSSSQTGFAPFIDLFFPATGRDGAGSATDDGVRFVSAQYQGQTLTAHVITFDASGQANHPLAVGSDGQPLVISAATFGMRAGDQLVVLELPFASVIQGQPTIGIQVTATLSNLADTTYDPAGGNPDLSIRARSGFQYGNDSLNNPASDPSLVEAGTVSYLVHPTVISFDQVVTTPEGETATGPNYGRELDVTITPATSQPLSSVVVTQPVPNNVIVTAITPGTSGTLTSITLYDGRTSSDPLLIQAALALNNDGNLDNDLYIREFTVTYANLTGPVTTNVQFFVADADANGLPVIDPISGDDVTITFGSPSAAGQWVPLDSRDVASPGATIAFTGAGDSVSFVAKSITLHKQVTLLTDVGATGLTPGDTLSYVLNIAISDYFAFGKNFFEQGSFTITDTLGNGQAYVDGSARLTIDVNGTPQTIALVAVRSGPDANGVTTLTLDLAQSLLNAFGARGWLNGDLAFDTMLQGATTAVISYRATVAQTYTPNSIPTHSEINEGDSLGNDATLTATILEDSLNLTGGTEEDGSSTLSTIPTNQVDITLADLNGGGAPAPGTELRPGDVVTFRLSYDLVTGDYENFKLTAYLPLPLFDLTGIVWSNGSGVGQWVFGAGDSNPDGSVTVTTGPGNSVIFNLGDYINSGLNGSRIEIEFTLRVSDQPFADQRAFNVLGESSQTTTLNKTVLLTTDDVTLIASVAEPELSISHGVVSASHGTVTGTTGGWNAPGSSGKPFTAASLSEIGAVDGSVTGIDGGDRLRLATAIENSGGGAAYDVSTRIVLPAGLSFVGGNLSSANLLVYRGDGTLLVAGTHYTVNNASNSITFIDGPGAGGLLAGRPGTAADSSGANLVVITYDVQVAANIAASATLQSNAELTRYASAEGGQNFLASGPLGDLADQQVAAPEIRKNYAGNSLDDGDSSATHTSGADLVVGESMLYDIIVTLPEGSTQSLSIDDLIPAGLRLDTSFNGNQGYQLITSAGGALSANFAGSISVASFAGAGGTLGGNGVDARFVFSLSAASADNNSNNNSFVIRVRLVVSNEQISQNATVLLNDAKLTYSDGDGDTPNGSTALSRDVALTGSKPAITVREPSLQISQQLLTAPGLGFDEGDPLEFTITIGNASGGSSYDAFDISFSDTLPSELNQLALVSVIYSLDGVDTDISASFFLNTSTRTLVNTGNVDIAKGGTVVIRVSGVVNASAAAEPNFDNQAQVRWTSLDGNSDGVANPAGERTGQDGTLSSSTLNNYRLDSTLLIPVAQGIRFSRVGGMSDTTAPSPTNAPSENVAIGEIVRYRATALVAEGDNPDYQLIITLDKGLSLDSLAGIRIGFISNGGLVTDLGDLITSGTLAIPGNEDSAQAQLIAADLSGAGPSGVLNTSYISITTDANGNQVITLNLGHITNGNTVGGPGDDGNDSDLEGIVIEFNARVGNSLDNQAGDSLGAVVEAVVGGLSHVTSNTLFENIVEPGFNALNKQVSDFTPNPAGSTGTATVTISFTQNGSLPAYNTHLTDSFPTGSNYNLVSISIGGTSYGPGNLPAGVTFSTSGGLTVDFVKIDIGTQISLVYTVDVPNSAAIASNNANLTWSSLPESFTGWGGTSVGADGTASGERTGANGAGPDASVLNNYMLSEGAGLGIISGTLWNDSASATTSTTPDGPGLAGQTVSLTWAGVDGNLATTADNQTFTTSTDANGQYRFGVLPAGVFRLDAPSGTITYPQPLGDLRVRIDSDAASPLGQIVVTLGEGASGVANAGYVEQNDAPVNSVPGTQSGAEDTPLPIAGISIADVDAGSATNISIALSVEHGTLTLAATPPIPGTVTVLGSGTATLTLIGSIADLNQALANLVYQGAPNFNGTDTLEVLTEDHGNFGDADGDGTPGENPQDGLGDSDTVTIVIAPVNDEPTANPDTTLAIEAGGTFNSLPGLDPRGNLLDNDTDVDIASNGDRLDLVSVTSPLGVLVPVPASGSVEIEGRYGKLIVNISGAYEYVLDNANPTVQALRQSGNTLSEVFTYTITDQSTANSSATLTVAIQGANDTPIGANDEGTAIEQGGVGNTDSGNPGDLPPVGYPVPGAAAAGNVLSNDSDVDAFGETKTVTGVRALRENVPGALRPVGVPLVGTYGTLTLNADGSYSYVIDNSNTAVQRLVPGATLFDYFSYQVTDALGLDDLAELKITIQGNYDNPLASDDQAAAQASENNSAGNESNPIGNVIRFPSRPGNVSDPGGNGVDSDVDRADRPNTVLLVNGVRNGTEAAVGTLTGVNGGPVTIAATYAENSGGVPIVSVEDFGSLTINPNGSFSFDVNSENDAIVALPLGQSLNVIFTYQITDSAGLTDTAQLVIIVRGANNVPHAQDEVAQGTEAGGIGNQTLGLDPSGSVPLTDPDGDSVSITGIRTGTEASGGAFTSVATVQTITGNYGTLTVFANGDYSYAIDNSLAAVQALRELSDVLIERFTYRVSDTNSLTDTAQITVVIRGQNDNPLAVNDAATAVEAGGLDNSSAGIDPIGNVLSNDSDVDGGEVAGDPIDYGETQAVASVRIGPSEGVGTSGILGSELRGTYGWLTLNPDGSYSYRLDNNMSAVQALRDSTNTLTDSFNYSVTDTDGATDNAILSITIRGANDSPVARDNNAIATEAGGLNNSTPGSNPSGNVLSNDSDVDLNSETLTVSGLRHGLSGGSIGSAFAGTYGSLTLNANGSFSYVLDNDNPQVQALRTTGNSLSENFTYTIRDLAGTTSTAILTITILGHNDNPLASNDSSHAQEAGGRNNATPGLDPHGNLLGNDSDIDAGDGKTVNGIRSDHEAAGGAFTSIGAVQVIAGSYGSLRVFANGDYSYMVDNSLAVVQALKPGDTLTEFFTYRMHDSAGAEDIAQLSLLIRGAWDTPTAQNDRGVGVADNGDGMVLNPSGNVLPNDNDIDQGDQLSVTAVRTGTESGSGIAGTVGNVLIGQYGSLILNADGSYTYTIDTSNPDILALGTLASLEDHFTYQVTDRGLLSDLAQLSILITGRNDPPVGVNDQASAIEASGLNNATPGLDPSGNVLANDTDLESDTLSVIAIRTGGEIETGTSGTLGSSLRGRYGDLIINADGSWSYRVDNSLAEVQALRASGQTLVDTFTYVLDDPHLADDAAELRITIDGRNDAPIASDDEAIAVEAGGIGNATPGIDPSGNVLGNDIDVDSIANGETRRLLDFSNELGARASAGQLLQGRYGSLTLNADGNYRYVLDNHNPLVQAMRTAGETLRETFTYHMRDTAGAESSARLNLLIQGANDNPVAANDRNVASDQSPAPQASGNVLPNDGDVDGGERLQVVGIRTGAEAGSGTAGSLGQPLLGRYGTLIINADGSYTYSIDLNNREVLAAAGLGQVLQDVFTYTLGDLAGATDLAELVIDLNIAAPYIEPPDSGGYGGWRPYQHGSQNGASPPLNFEPAVFVSPVVEASNEVDQILSLQSDGSDLRLSLPYEMQSEFLHRTSASLEVPGQFVRQSIGKSSFASELDLAWLLGRQERIELTADGLLSDPSLFISDPADMTRNHQPPAEPAEEPQAQTARSFQHQLQAAAKRLNPLGQANPRS